MVAKTRLTPEEKVAQKLLALAKQHRGRTCAGCRNNRYNFKVEGDGWNGATSGEGCWHLVDIRRGKCPHYSNY